MAAWKKNLKNVSGTRIGGTVRTEGGTLVLTLSGTEGKELYAGARTERGFVRLGRVTEGENRCEIGTNRLFALLVGDEKGPVACFSEDGNIGSLYGDCDRLKEPKPPTETALDGTHGNARSFRERQSAETSDSGSSVPSDRPQQKAAEPDRAPSEPLSMDLSQMGVTDPLMWEDSTLSENPDSWIAAENYYQKEKENRKKMQEYFAQIETLLSGGERDADLEAVFPSSRFVRIDFDGEGKYYVVGAVYEEKEIRYVCYGVPVQESKVPARFVGVAQYVEAGTKGYLILYQDARTGTMLTAKDFL